MIRFIFIVLQLLILAAGGFWLFKNPGTAHIEWMGYDIDTSFALIVAGLAAFLFLSNVLWISVKFIFTLPWQIRKLLKKRHLSKGISALYKGLLALEQRDQTQLQKHAARIRKFLNEPALALYLEGIAARSVRDNSTAHEKFRALSQLPQGEALGILASLKLALAEQHWPIAWSLYEQMPEDIDLSVDILGKMLDVALELEHFENALDILALLKKQKQLSTYELRSLRAKVALHRSKYLLERHHNEDAAYVAAQEAYDLEANIRAALQLVPLLLKREKNRKAKDVLKSVWESYPTEDIVPFIQQLDANSSTLNAYSLLKDWTQDMPDHPERMLILGRCALHAHLWGEARAHVHRLAAYPQYEHKRNLLLADIEYQEHHDAEKARLIYRQLLDGPVRTL